MPGPDDPIIGNTGHDVTSTARAGVYELLATVFRAPLGAANLRRFRSEEFLDALGCAGMRLDDEFKLTDEKTLLEMLAVDFTQLFHGPRQHRVANESVQTGDGEGTLDGAASVEVQEFYRSVGLCLNETQAELPDHISVELAGMAALARAEAEALDAGERSEAQRHARHQAEFLATHLGRWGPDLGRWVGLRARTPFYREAGHLLAEFLEADMAGVTRRARASKPMEKHAHQQSGGEQNHVRTGAV